MAFMRHSSPQLKPSGYTEAMGESAGNGTFCRLRGMDTETVWPEEASTLITDMESGRRPSRSSPASPPMSRML